MAALAFLVASWLGAFVVVQRLAPDLGALARIAGTVVVGIVLTGWVAFGAAWLAHTLGNDDATWVGCGVATAVNVGIALSGRQLLRGDAVRLTRSEKLGAGAALAVAAWTMHARLSGDPLTVSANTWGDTALHLGIARSFSEGANFPPQLPLFAGESIRYHFGFDFYAGALERTGVPIGLAFNLPGALAYAAVLLLLVELGRLLWRSAWVGAVAAVLFATNGSLAFLRYLDAQPSLSAALTPSRLWNHVGYDGGGPYNGDEIAIFWTPNAYLTQTHLIVALALVLFGTLALLRHLWDPGDGRTRPALTPARSAVLGLVLGASFWINGIVVVAAGVFALALFTVHRVPLRTALAYLGTAGVVALPQLVWLNGGFGAGGSASFHAGYLVEDFHAASPGSWVDFTRYWWLNLGLVLPLIVLAAVRGTRAERRLLAAVMTIFVLGNLVAFGRELGGHNHKVFNLWEVLVNLFAAYALVSLVRALWSRRGSGRMVLAHRSTAVVAAGAAAVLLVLSGVLDLMTLKNDARYPVIGDRAAAVTWIREHTPTDAVFLTAYGEVYTTPTLAGRRVYLGGFGPWTAIMGYDSVPREQRIASIYTAPDQATACERLRGLAIDYLEVGYPEFTTRAFATNTALFPSGFTAAWSDGRFTFYDVQASCGAPDRTSPAETQNAQRPPPA